MAAANQIPHHAQIKGYPLQILGGAVDSKYKCSSCKLLLRDPIQSFCGHRFCRLCLEYLISSEEGAICPVCKVEDADNEFAVLSVDQTFPDNAIKREFAALNVRCTFSHGEETCQWLGKFKEYELHVKECPLRPYPCDCGAEVTFKYLGNHKATECPNRVMQCQFCQKEVVYQELQAHQAECPQFPTVCQQCGQKVVREKLAAHQDPVRGDCENLAILCPFGCGQQVERNKVMEHMKETIPLHFKNISDRILNMETNTREALESLYGKITQTDSTVSQIKQENESTPQSDVQSQDMNEINSKFGIVEARLSTFENVVSVLTREIERHASRVESFEQQRQTDRSTIDSLETKVKSMERMVALKDVSIAEQDLRLSALEQTSTDGILLWKISDYSRKRQEAIAGKVTSLYSPAFYTSRHGYKMCARIYLNGDGMGKGSHISLFFVVMRGHYDALLRWPFRQKVTLMLLDQNHREHAVDAFRPDPASSSFKRPTSDMNIASGCPLFMPLSQIESPGHAYIKDDTIFIKVNVDCGDLKNM